MPNHNPRLWPTKTWQKVFPDQTRLETMRNESFRRYQSSLLCLNSLDVEHFAVSIIIKY